MDITEDPAQQTSVSEEVVQQTEQLIKSLYATGSPAEIGRIQDQLQQFQKSKDAWDIAYRLLNSNDANVKFFAALTFTVKVNSTWDQDKDWTYWRDRLYNKFLSILNHGISDGSVLIRKLLSSLVPLSFRNKQADNPLVVKAVLLAFAKNNPHHFDLSSLQEEPTIGTLLTLVNPGQLVGVFLLCTALAEEVVKLDSKIVASHRLNVRVEMNLQTVLELIFCVVDVLLPEPHFNLEKFKAGDDEAKSLAYVALETLEAWINFGLQFGFQKDSKASFTRLMPHVLVILHIPILQALLAGPLCNLLEHFPSMLDQDAMGRIRQFLADEPLATHMHAVFEDKKSMDDIEFYLSILEAYLSNQQLAMFKGEGSAQALDRKVLSQAHTLLKGRGVPEVEDEFCTIGLARWSDVAEWVNQALFDDEGSSAGWMGEAKADLGRVVEEIFPRLFYPPTGVLKTWNAEQRTKFNGIRKDFEDYLLTVYPFLGSELLAGLANVTMNAMETRSWEALELAFFSLSALGDVVAGEDEMDQYLKAVFFSKDFGHLCHEDLVIPEKTRQAAVKTIGSYTAFFARNHFVGQDATAFAQVLGFLFRSLESFNIALAASKSIVKICDMCRVSLVPELDNLLRHIRDIVKLPSTNTTTAERLFEAVAMVIQAMPNEEARIAPIAELMTYVNSEVNLVVACMEKQAEDEAQRNALSSLKYMASIGKGLRTPDNEPIDLERTTDSSANSLWLHGQGRRLRESIVSLLARTFETVSTNGDITEAMCEVLKAGYTEAQPGPFVFEPKLTVDFVTKYKAGEPCIDVVMATASAFLASHSSNPSRVDFEASMLIQHAHKLFASMEESLDLFDPEIAYSCIDFLGRLLPKYSFVLFERMMNEQSDEAQAVASIFRFTLKSLAGTQPLPKRSAAGFWTTFLQLPDQHTMSRIHYERMMTMIKNLTPDLVEIFVVQFAGEAARSELDVLSEPFKKLISRHSLIARPEVSTAINDAGNGGVFPPAAAEKVNATERRIFCAKIFNLRGAKETNRVVREFWKQCRGTNFAYAE